MNMLSGKTALITGGSSGIGLATARMLRDQGAQVALMGRSQERLDRARDELGEDVLAIAGDVASLEDLARMRKQLENEIEALDMVRPGHLLIEALGSRARTP